MISGQQNQNISYRYCNMRHYQNPALKIRNRLATWPFFLKLCVLFRSSFAFNFLVMFIVVRTFPSLFFFYYLIFVHCNDCIPICIICSWMLGPVCLRKATKKQGNVTFETPIKTCYTVPVIVK